MLRFSKNGLPTEVVISILCLVFLGGCSAADKGSSHEIIAAPTAAEDDLMIEAVEAYDEAMYTLAVEKWTALRDGYPAGYYATFAELKIADAQFYAEELAAAAAAYEEFARLHPGHEAMPYVRYQIGKANEEQYRGLKHDPTPLHSAVKSYQKLLSDHSDSDYVPLARRGIDRCRELIAAHEAVVARFYLQQGQQEAAAKRLVALAEEYADTKAAAEALAEMEVIGNSDGPVAMFKGEESTDSAAQHIPSKPVIVHRGEDTEASVRQRIDKADPNAALGASGLISASSGVGSELSNAGQALEHNLRVLSLDCQKRENGEFFLVKVSSRVELDPPHGTELRNKEGALKRTAARLRVSDFEQEEAALGEALSRVAELRCETGGVSLEIVRESAVSQPSSTRYWIVLSHPSDSVPMFFSLENPHRVIAVVERPRVEQ